ncbi:MAG: hypothetical protein LBS40_03080 [Burkholderiales bacterium]|jgi:uncharacterized protein YycO|nr:hypothetical protein [Burkholderiales bacterium]
MRIDRNLWGALLFFAAEIVAAQSFQEGDLIFREGTEWVSEAVRIVDDGPFSHVGMIVGSEGRWQVLHATPAERPGGSDIVILDDLAFFIAPERSRHFAVYRVWANTDQSEKAVRYLRSQLGKTFSIGNDEKDLYCTTLVWRAWQAAGVDLKTPFTYLNIPLISGEYLLPNVLSRSPLLTEVAQKKTISTKQTPNTSLPDQ